MLLKYGDEVAELMLLFPESHLLKFKFYLNIPEAHLDLTRT